MNLTQLKTSNALASYLRYPKRKFAEAVRQSLEDHDMISFNLSYFEYCDSFPNLKHLLFYCSSQTEKNLSKLWDWEKFITTPLAGEFIDMNNNIEENFVFTYALNSSVFAVTESDSYDGVGGIFVRRPRRTDPGIVIEPFKHFLTACEPLPEID